MIKLKGFQQRRKALNHFLKCTYFSKKFLIYKKTKSLWKAGIKREITFIQTKEKINHFYDSNKKYFVKYRIGLGVVSVATAAYGLNKLRQWLFHEKDLLKKDNSNDVLTKEEEDAIEKILNAIIDSYTENVINQDTEKPAVTESLTNNRFKPVKNVTTTFNDIQGCDEAKQDLQNLIYFLRNPKKFNEIGATLPKGIILVGPPGVGKTSLARAVAGEAKVPFINASGSEFDEMYVGVGASRIRELFESAKSHAPCVVFIDELDAISNKKIDSALRQSQNQTLSQLLVELDGFQSSSGIIVLSATNNKDALDKALIRPGRFDIELELLPPDLEGRKALFKLYLGQVRCEELVDYEKLAKGSVGFTGAEIKNMVNQAALMAGINDEKMVKIDHLWKARDRIMMGLARKKIPDNDANRITAFHEAGHALTAFLTPDSETIHKVTIIPRNHSLGYTSFIEEKELHHLTKSQLQARIDALMGGKIAEELIYGQDRVTTGGSSDIKKATLIAENMVMNLGMSKRLNFRSFPNSNSGSLENNLSSNTKTMIDEEINRILKESHERVNKLLVDNSDKLKLLAETLLKNETLDNTEVAEILIEKSPFSKINNVLGNYKNWVMEMSSLSSKKILRN